MRSYVLAAIAGLAGFAAGAAVVEFGRPAPPPSAVAPAQPSGPGDTAAIAPVAPPPSPSPSPSPSPDVTTLPGPGTPAATSPGPASDTAAPAARTDPDRPPDLPNVDIASHAVHAVPSNDEAPAPTVTLQDRDGRKIKDLKPDSGLAPGYVPSVGPGGARSYASTTPPATTGGARLAMAPSTAAYFNGAGQATGGTVISVGGRFVNLFGVRIADSRDRCGLGLGDNRSCAQVARDALAQRFAHYPNVSCHVPPGQPGQPGAVCTDASGTDLGGFLVAEGYALADTSRSYDYFGAEGVARSYRRGLWRYR